MPELASGFIKFLNEAEKHNEDRIALRRGYKILEVSQDGVNKAARKTGFKLAGYGDESFVLSKPGDHRVYSIHRFPWAANDLRMLYHSHRIFSTWFPNNFPRFYGVFTRNEPSLVTGIVRQKISAPRELSFLIRTIDYLKLGDRLTGLIRYPYANVADDCNATGVPLPRQDGFKNFSYASDNGIYYMDVVFPMDSGDPLEFVTRLANHTKVFNQAFGSRYTRRELEAVEHSADRLLVYARAEIEKRNLDFDKYKAVIN